MLIVEMLFQLLSLLGNLQRNKGFIRRRRYEQAKNSSKSAQPIC